MLRRPGLRRGWAHALLQLGMFLVADLLYESVRDLVVGAPGPAFAHARAIVDLESSLGIFVEPGIQRAVVGHRAVMQVADWFYLNVQFTANAAFLAFLYLRRRAVYTRTRDAMFIAMAVALVVHLLLPVAPPRLLAGHGYVDTIKSLSHVDQDSGAIGAMVNRYAAVPSMHACFALIVGLTGARLATSRIAALAWAVYPGVVVAVVVITANHFILDIVAGGFTAAIAWALAGAPARRSGRSSEPAPGTPAPPVCDGGRAATRA